MNDSGKNKRVLLLILLAVFVAGGAYVVFSLAAAIAPARTVFFEKEFYQADIVFSEDLECIDSFSEAKMLTNLEFDKSSETESRDEIKPVIFRQGKVYQLKALMQISAVNENMRFEEHFRIRCDDGQWAPIGFSESAGESKEYHNKYLDGTYVTTIGFDKIESYEKVLPELKKAKEDFLSPYLKNEKTRVFRYNVLPVCIYLICSLAISALALFIHKRMTAAGKSGTVLTVIFVIIDIPVVGLLLLLLLSRCFPYL
ncbi:MAG: hypothetical protein VZR26_08405 [Erysipelotrichaceae bacterium]|nr:hypothetical protein [Erysipelotrichaceae bacterium]